MNKQEFKTNRKALNLTQAQLAQELGYNQATISRAEKGIVSKKLLKAFDLLILNKQKNERKKF